MRAEMLTGISRARAAGIIKENHYTRSIPSGKSHYIQYGDAIVVWSIPANKNIAKFILGFPGNVWELSRLWAPDGHDRNLLTRAISAAVSMIRRLENPDALVSYADPNAGHRGGVYRAASWQYHGKSEEVRTYLAPEGTMAQYPLDLGLFEPSSSTIARRAFHSGSQGMTKAEIEARGYAQLSLPGKERFVKPLSRAAKRILSKPRVDIKRT